jgi:hypothetical protein
VAELRPYKVVKWRSSTGGGERWVIQLPAGVEAPGRVYLISERPLIVSELPGTCEREAVMKVAGLLRRRWFRRAVGSEYWEAVRRLVEGCGVRVEAEGEGAAAVRA